MTDLKDFLSRAQCRVEHVDLKVFYPRERAGRISVDGRIDPYVEARAICARCPVRDECAELGDQDVTSRQFGMWGGLTPSQRRYRRTVRRKESA